MELLVARDWQAAHEIVQKDKSTLAAWLHGIVHTIEGDLDNARYWYRPRRARVPWRRRAAAGDARRAPPSRVEYTLVRPRPIERDDLVALAAAGWRCPCPASPPACRAPRGPRSAASLQQPLIVAAGRASRSRIHRSPPWQRPKIAQATPGGAS